MYLGFLWFFLWICMVFSGDSDVSLEALIGIHAAELTIK
jgi:hypothetical protein